MMPAGSTETHERVKAIFGVSRVVDIRHDKFVIPWFCVLQFLLGLLVAGNSQNRVEDAGNGILFLNMCVLQLSALLLITPSKLLLYVLSAGLYSRPRKAGAVRCGDEPEDSAEEISVHQKHPIVSRFV
jgi:hypothetical protein